MKTQRPLIIISILIWMLTGLSMAIAESGIENRQIFVGANVRALGMGSAFTAGPSSSDSLFWNPSSLGFLSDSELSVVGLPFSQEADNREGAFSLALNPYQLGIVTEEIGNFSFSSWFDGWGNDGEKNRMMLVGYGISLGEGISAGANLRHHRRSRSMYTQLGWSFDIGGLFAHKLERLGDQIAFGLTFEDLGGHLWENGQLVEKMPPVTRLGTTYSLDSDTILSGDLALRNDRHFDLQNRFRAHLGAERWLFHKQLGIRIGYTAIPNYDRFTEGEWSRGFSLRNESGELDYAYVSGGDLEQGVHWISATFRWGGAADAPVEQPPVATTAPTPPAQPAPIVMPPQVKSTLIVSEEAISPNGDGVSDQTVFDFDGAGEKAWQIDIQDEYTEIVKTYSGTGSPTKGMSWDGRDAQGHPVSDGTYTAQLVFLDEAGNRHVQSRATITVDTMPADIEISTEPPLLVSNGVTSSDKGLVVNVPRVQVQVSDLNPIAHWELQFFNAQRQPVDQIQGEGKPPDVIAWNNWRKHQADANATTDYRCALTVSDIAGNRSTQEAAFSLVDLRRNPVAQPEAVEARQDARGIVLTLAGVAFESNSYEIKAEYRSALEKAAQTLASYPDAQVIIEGHTDDIGEAGYNLELSRKRANAVMTYFIDLFGVDPSRLSAIGYGEERPIAPNDTEENRQRNRRVEIILLTTQDPSSPEEEIAAQGVSNHSETPVENPSTPLPKYTLLVSSFKNRQNAEVLVEALEALDLNAAVRLSEVTIRSEPWYRVTIGQFREKTEATELISQLKASQGIEPLVIKEP